MSEYWKSTPKYYCKYCEKYVNDTKFGRSEHEKTDRHQNSLKKFLSQLHRSNAKTQKVEGPARPKTVAKSAPEPHPVKFVPKKPKPNTLDESYEFNFQSPQPAVADAGEGEWQIVEPQVVGPQIEGETDDLEQKPDISHETIPIETRLQTSRNTAKPSLGDEDAADFKIEEKQMPTRGLEGEDPLDRVQDGESKPVFKKRKVARPARRQEQSS